MANGKGLKLQSHKALSKSWGSDVGNKIFFSKKTAEPVSIMCPIKHRRDIKGKAWFTVTLATFGRFKRSSNVCYIKEQILWYIRSSDPQASIETLKSHQFYTTGLLRKLRCILISKSGACITPVTFILTLYKSWGCDWTPSEWARGDKQTWERPMFSPQLYWPHGISYRHAAIQALYLWYWA